MPANRGSNKEWLVRVSPEVKQSLVCFFPLAFRIAIDEPAIGRAITSRKWGREPQRQREDPNTAFKDVIGPEGLGREVVTPGLIILPLGVPAVFSWSAPRNWWTAVLFVRLYWRFVGSKLHSCFPSPVWHWSAYHWLYGWSAPARLNHADGPSTHIHSRSGLETQPDNRVKGKYLSKESWLWSDRLLSSRRIWKSLCRALSWSTLKEFWHSCSILYCHSRVQLHSFRLNSVSRYPELLHQPCQWPAPPSHHRHHLSNLASGSFNFLLCGQVFFSMPSSSDSYQLASFIHSV